MRISRTSTDIATSIHTHDATDGEFWRFVSEHHSPGDMRIHLGLTAFGARAIVDFVKVERWHSERVSFWQH